MSSHGGLAGLVGSGPLREAHPCLKALAPGSGGDWDGGASIGGWVAWGRWVAQRPGSPLTCQVPGPPAAAGAEQQTNRGESAGLGVELPACEHVALCELGLLFPPAVQPAETNLEARPSTWYRPAALEIIQLRQLLSLCAGPPRINPLPFKVLIGCACLTSRTPEA